MAGSKKHVLYRQNRTSKYQIEQTTEVTPKSNLATDRDNHHV